MQDAPLSKDLRRQHLEVTRRYFMRLGAAGLGATQAVAAWAKESDAEILEEATSDMEYLTYQDEFGTVQRGQPLPYTLSKEKRLEIGLERETWKLEVVPDPESNAAVVNPMTRKKGNALDFKGLMKLAEKHAVRFLKVMSCNNMKNPLGMGLWEGVPLRNVIWLAKPTVNVRRVFYYGHHNEDPKQMFRSSLPIGRALEDPPGDNPIILCYKLNGEWLTGKRGGPVACWYPTPTASNPSSGSDRHLDQRPPSQRHLRGRQQRHRQLDEDHVPVRLQAGKGKGRRPHPRDRIGPGGRGRIEQGTGLD